jgi:nitrite reductase (NO-forming)
VADQIPPLAKSDFLQNVDKDDIIRGVIAGRTGEITVNGKKYNGTMISLAYLSDEQIANVLTFVRNSWGNSGDAIAVADVLRIRQETPQPAAKSNFE